MFLSLAVIAPPLTGLPIWPVSGILLLLTGTNVAAALLVRVASTVRQLDAVGIGIQLSSGVLLLLLFVAIDKVERFAALTLTAQSIFAFVVSRHPFRNAAAISAGHTLNYAIVGFATGLGPGILVDAFILGAAVAGASAGTYAAERRERRLFAQGLVVERLHRRVDELLHRYLAPQVADSLIADPARAELGGEEVEVTVLFADLTGFTSYSERVRPDEAVGMLNAAFGTAVPVVVDEGGTVVQFAGDAMMVIFNAPARQADHAVRAARAALGLQAATAVLPSLHERPRFRVGINTGLALVGNVGSPQMRSFTAIGDSANLAAHLQTFSPTGKHCHRPANSRVAWGPRRGAGAWSTGAEGQVGARHGL
jgi:class 3 adenylate cyclase